MNLDNLLARINRVLLRHARGELPTTVAWSQIKAYIAEYESHLAKFEKK